MIGFKYDTFTLGLCFPDPADAKWAFAEASRTIGSPDHRAMYLLENPNLHIAFSPFLSALQRLEYRNLSSSMMRTISNPDTSTAPAYVSAPGFAWDLSLLVKPSIDLRTDISSSSIEAARGVLHTHGTLDPTQSNAVISALTSEVALIQGPPGTGKTYTGVQLIRTLLRNKVQPIVLMAQTNHALDNILRAVFLAEKDGMGKKVGVVRLGKGTTDEVVKRLEFSERTKKVNKTKKQRLENGLLKSKMKEVKDVSGQ